MSVILETYYISDLRNFLKLISRRCPICAKKRTLDLLLSRTILLLSELSQSWSFITISKPSVGDYYGLKPSVGIYDPNIFTLDIFTMIFLGT